MGGKEVLQFCYCVEGTLRRHVWECPGHAARGHTGTSHPDRAACSARLCSHRAVCAAAGASCTFQLLTHKSSSSGFNCIESQSPPWLKHSGREVCMRIHSGYRRYFPRYDHVKREHNCVTNPKAMTLLSLMFPLRS